MYTTLSGKEISLSKKIAKGGEGEVFEILGNRGSCIKIYHKHIRSKEKEEKLKYMVLNPPSDLQGINYKICWPKDVIYEEGEFVGFMMYKAFDNSLLPYHLCQPLIPKKLSNQWHTTFNRKTFKGRTSRLKLSVNIIAVVNRIHNNKRYIIVDLKPQNLLVTAFGKVSIIDMDSVQIVQNEKVLFKAPVSTPEYTPPEASDIIRSKIPITKDWDTFSLGVLVYEILCGIHPYVGSAKPPFDNLNTIQEKIKENLTHVTKGESAFSVLPPLQKIFYDYSDDLKNIFKRIFCPYKIGITVRPSLDEFGETLFNAVALLEEDLKKEEQKRLEQEKIKKKLEEKEAIENYKKLKNDYDLTLSKLAVHRSDNTSLRKQLEETKNKPNALVPVLVICLLIFMGLFIGNYSSNDKLLKKYNLLMDDYNIDTKNLKTEVSSLKNEILKSAGYERVSENRRLELKNKIKNQQREISRLKVKSAPITISEIFFDSWDGDGYGFKNKRNNLPRSKSFYLYPSIVYQGKVDQTLKLKVMYFYPDGSSDGPGANSYKFYKGIRTVELSGWGNRDGNWLNAGSHKIEIWFDGVKIYQQYFSVTND
jgi:serine/threonine protein kinase